MFGGVERIPADNCNVGGTSCLVRREFLPLNCSLSVTLQNVPSTLFPIAWDVLARGLAGAFLC